MVLRQHSCHATTESFQFANPAWHNLVITSEIEMNSIFETGVMKAKGLRHIEADPFEMATLRSAATGAQLSISGLKLVFFIQFCAVILLFAKRNLWRKSFTLEIKNATDILPC
jgi:hypothetical protein